MARRTPAQNPRGAASNTRSGGNGGRPSGSTSISAIGEKISSRITSPSAPLWSQSRRRERCPNLEQVFHSHDLSDAGGGQGEAHFLERRRAHPDARIAGEAEALARDSQRSVE